MSHKVVSFPLFFTLFTNDCVSSHDSVIIFNFSVDTTVDGIIWNSDERVYWEEVERLVDWCDVHNLVLNASKTKEMIIENDKSDGFDTER